MKKFLKWWKIGGELWGFVLLICTLCGIMIGFMDEMRENSWLSLVWIVLFFGGTSWYAWQMRLHGWNLPKNIKNTH